MELFGSISTSPPLDQSFPDANGREHSIKQALESGPVLLGIYKSSCAASKVMLPMLQRIQNAHATDGLTTFGVAQDSPNITRSFARRYGLDIPLLIEGPGFPLSAGFDIRATPTVFLLRRDGSIAYTTMGFLRDQVEDIEAAVAGELGVPSKRIVDPAESEIPLFVPG
jgi:thiol-disulfide isomerase/thioredoxin